MISPRKYLLVQRVLLLSGLFGVLYFFLVLRPLCERVNALDKPLQDSWLRLQKTRLADADVNQVDLESMRQTLRRLNSSWNALTNFASHAIERTRPDAVVREKMRQPFQLVEFQNERQLLREDLDRLARTNKVSLAAPVFQGYPEYSPELTQPALLWTQLAMVQQVLVTAIQCGVTGIESVTPQPSRGIYLEEYTPPVADEISTTFQLYGSPLAINRFLCGLPVRTPEAMMEGLPEIPAAKPDLFIDRLVVRKDQPEKPDFVRLEVRISGLVYRD